MKREIKKFKVISWYNEDKKETFFGIDVVMKDGSSYHVCDSKKPLFFVNEIDAEKEAKRLNSEQGAQVSDTTDAK